LTEFVDSIEDWRCTPIYGHSSAEYGALRYAPAPLTSDRTSRLTPLGLASASGPYPAYRRL